MPLFLMIHDTFYILWVGVRENKSAPKLTKLKVRENKFAQKFSNFAQSGCAKIYTDKVVIVCFKHQINFLCVNQISIKGDDDFPSSKNVSINETLQNNKKNLSDLYAHPHIGTEEKIIHELFERAQVC